MSLVPWHQKQKLRRSRRSSITTRSKQPSNVPQCPLPSSQAPIRGRQACFIGSIQGQLSSFSHQTWLEFLKAAECGLLSPAKSAKGTALVTLSEGSRDTTYPGVFIELTASRKLRTNAGETKAMQPVNMPCCCRMISTTTWARSGSWRFSLAALPPAWDALLSERQYVALGVPLADSPLEVICQPYWLPNFLTDLVLVLLTALVVQGHWHDL